MYMCRYNIVTREAKQLMLLPGDYDANENDVEMYYVKVDLGVRIVTRYRNERSMSSCYILHMQQKETKGTCVLDFT